MQYNETSILQKDYSSISINKLVRNLNLDDDLVDTEHLQSLLDASIDWVETRINGFVVPTTIELSVYDFKGDKIELEHKGFNNISSFTVNDEVFTDYIVIKKYSSAQIRFNTAITIESDIKITYESGKTPSNNLVQAVIINASDMYDVDRSNYSSGLVNNRTVMRLLNLE